MIVAGWNMHGNMSADLGCNVVTEYGQKAILRTRAEARARIRLK